MNWILPYFLFNEHDHLFSDESMLRRIFRSQLTSLDEIGASREKIFIVTNLSDFDKIISVPDSCQIVKLNDKNYLNPWQVFRQLQPFDSPVTIFDPHYPLLYGEYFTDLATKDIDQNLFLVEQAPVHPFYLLQDVESGEGIDFLISRCNKDGKIIIGRQHNERILTLSTSFCRLNSWVHGVNSLGREIPAGNWQNLAETRTFSLANGIVDYFCILEIENYPHFHDLVGESFTMEAIAKLYHEGDI